MTITTTQLIDETHLLDNAIDEDILVTKKGKLFTVVIDAKRYEELIANQKPRELENPRAGWEAKIKAED